MRNLWKTSTSHDFLPYFSTEFSQESPPGFWTPTAGHTHRRLSELCEQSRHLGVLFQATVGILWEAVRPEKGQFQWEQPAGWFPRSNPMKVDYFLGVPLFWETSRYLFDHIWSYLIWIWVRKFGVFSSWSTCVDQRVATTCHHSSTRHD